MIQISGVLSRLTFHSPDTHYTVARIQVDSVQDPITVVGYLAGVAEGETLSLTGQWASHPKYGEQFRVETYEVTLPATISGIRRYLGSGLIRGINQALANRIVDKFQEQTLDIIENQPDRLLEVSGIGKAKKEQVEKAWNTHHGVRRVMQFLQTHGMNIAHAGLILKTYGAEALQVLESTPYLIAQDIPVIGFATVDPIAMAAGIEPDDPHRLAACLICQLLVAEGEGHVYQPKSELLAACARVAGVSGEILSDPLDTLAARKEITVDDDRVYLARLYRAEKGIADRLAALLTLPAPRRTIRADQIREQVMTGMAVALSDEQMAVITQVLALKVSIITGGPGTGKTTLVRALCRIFGHLGQTVVLAAPTGRAARRLSEVTGHKAATLHKLLGYDPDTNTFLHGPSNPLAADVLVVDESSMVDTLLMHSLMESLPAAACLILVGDTFQLPSVGPGTVLSDIMTSERIRVFYLTEIFRQALKSPIVQFAHAIRNGEMPDFKLPPSSELSEFYFIENQDGDKVVETILELCINRIPRVFTHIEDLQVLTPMHRGSAGTITLNQRLQAAINPTGPAVVHNGITFRQGDKVMHLKNNYEKEVFNGDIGVVTEIRQSENGITVTYDGRAVPYELQDLDELTLAYAISVHKSQGSEYGAVIIAMTTSHYPLLQRNLLYTAMTRGRHLVVIVGSSRAVRIALENTRTALRRTHLRERLRKRIPNSGSKSCTMKE